MAEALDEVRRVEQDVERQVMAQGSNPSPAGGMPAAAVAQPAPRPVVAQPLQPLPVNVDIAMAARRDALARRLLGAPRQLELTSLPGRIASIPPAASSPPSTADAMESLRRRYEDRVSRAKAARGPEVRGQRANRRRRGRCHRQRQRVPGRRPARPRRRRSSRGPLRRLRRKADAILAETYLEAGRLRGAQRPVGRGRAVVGTRVQGAPGRRGGPRARGQRRRSRPTATCTRRLASAQRACRARSRRTPPYRVTLAKVYVAAGLAAERRVASWRRRRSSPLKMIRLRRC